MRGSCANTGEDLDHVGPIASVRHVHHQRVLKRGSPVAAAACADHGELGVATCARKEQPNRLAIELQLGERCERRTEVVRGHQRGRELGYATANLEEHCEGFVPAPGVYGGTLELGGITYFAGISVGTNPTFTDVDRLQVEAHALDADFDAYGLTGTITFTHRLRDTLKFDGIESLIAAMDQDVREIRELIAAGEITIP